MSKKEEKKTYVPDTSAIIDGALTELVSSGKLTNAKLVIPEAVISELEHLANLNKETGFIGLEELEKIRNMSKVYNIEIVFHGKRPDLEDITIAKSGRIDALIRDTAKEFNGILITSDKIQAKVARIYGIETILIEKSSKEKVELPSVFQWFEKYKNMMSLHLKEGCKPLGKIGEPGNWKLEVLEDKVYTEDELEDIITSIVEYAKKQKKGVIEIERRGSLVIQMEQFRIAIARKPFSDGVEITIVRPTIKRKLEDYNLPKEVLERLEKHAYGILIAGPPGSGKSTFCQALAEFYLSKNKIVKTMESPRDLQVPNEITQYAPLEGSMEYTGDFILLVRPDYTIYDEVRKIRDFEIFIDLRLAGIGMIGVVHANRPIDAIQRFIGKTDLGLIPQVIDTVIFIDKGKVAKIYEISMKVKVPSGMKDQDLARPVIEVRDFITKKLEYEIYSFGEEVVTIPIGEKGKAETKLEKIIKETILKNLDIPISEKLIKIELSDNRITLYAPACYIPYIIGRRGKTVEKLEKIIGMPIDVRELQNLERVQEITAFQVKDTGKKLTIKITDPEIEYDDLIEIEVDGESLGIFKLGRKKRISISKDNELYYILKNNKFKLYKIKT